jgi:hypothetical protein
MSEPIYIGGRETPLTPKEAEQFKKDCADFFLKMLEDAGWNENAKVITPEEARKWAPGLNRATATDEEIIGVIPPFKSKRKENL